MNLEKMLVDALKSKDRIIIEEAFKMIYDSYFKLVYFCIANIIDSKEDAEELTNDVFLKFFNHLDNININGSIKYYLTTSAKNTALNFYKKQKRIVVCDSFDNFGVNNNYQGNEIIDKIKENLTIEESSLIIDHVLTGKSLKELAIESNSNINTTKSKYRRAVLKLRNVLGGAKHE